MGNIVLTYQPGKGISLNDLSLPWDTERQLTRQLLKGKYKANDNVIDVSRFNDGDASKNIVQRRDIYNNYKEQDNLFFLNFDEADRLRDVEIHHGIDINVNGVMIHFSMNIEKVAELLDTISDDKELLMNGEYFFNDLKLTIASGEAMGGEGDDLAYFYCSKDVEHL